MDIGRTLRVHIGRRKTGEETGGGHGRRPGDQGGVVVGGWGGGEGEGAGREVLM